ncbi:hypothetical protein BCE02nite_56120 [Brevibacillus centrosporus]|nr:hypothetical protein BCE02nite_56120 [Brevibacillus centrosporus]
MKVEKTVYLILAEAMSLVTNVFLAFQLAFINPNTGWMPIRTYLDLHFAISDEYERELGYI